MSKNKKEVYGIRKTKIAVGSVLLFSLFLSSPVLANTNVSTSNTENVAGSPDTNSPGTNNNLVSNINSENIELNLTSLTTTKEVFSNHQVYIDLKIGNDVELTNAKIVVEVEENETISLSERKYLVGDLTKVSDKIFEKTYSTLSSGTYYRIPYSLNIVNKSADGTYYYNNGENVEVKLNVKIVSENGDTIKTISSDTMTWKETPSSLSITNENSSLGRLNGKLVHSTTTEDGTSATKGTINLELKTDSYNQMKYNKLLYLEYDSSKFDYIGDGLFKRINDNVILIDSTLIDVKNGLKFQIKDEFSNNSEETLSLKYKTVNKKNETDFWDNENELKTLMIPLTSKPEEVDNGIVNVNFKIGQLPAYDDTFELNKRKIENEGIIYSTNDDSLDLSLELTHYQNKKFTLKKVL